LLSASVQMIVGGDRAIPVELAEQIRRQWTAGRVEMDFSGGSGTGGGIVHLTPQHANPRPAVVANRQFKAALMHAMDRQEMASELQAGLVPVVNSPIPLGDANFAAIQSQMVTYEY